MIQAKVLTPNDFANLAQVELRLRRYEESTNSRPEPFDWKFTRADLFDLLQRLAANEAEAASLGSTGNSR
jgi:hypothetical protein